MRVTASGSTSSVVLQRNARSVNVTSSTAVASTAMLKPTAATCDQHMSCHFANRAALERPARQSNMRASSGDARVNRRNTASARAPGFSGAMRSCTPRNSATRPGRSSKLATRNSAGMTTSSAIRRTTLTGCEPSYWNAASARLTPSAAPSSAITAVIARRTRSRRAPAPSSSDAVARHQPRTRCTRSRCSSVSPISRSRRLRSACGVSRSASSHNGTSIASSNNVVAGRGMRRSYWQGPQKGLASGSRLHRR